MRVRGYGCDICRGRCGCRGGGWWRCSLRLDLGVKKWGGNWVIIKKFVGGGCDRCVEREHMFIKDDMSR